MPARWKLFRIICILQMLSASVFGILGLISLFNSGTMFAFITSILYLFIFLLTILAINIVNNNYPNVPVTGKQKNNFNWLFLINFLFLVFLFGFIFAEYRELKIYATLVSKPVFELPWQLFIPSLVNIATLIFQFIILYGLYELRRELYFNFMKREFEFEKDQPFV